MSDYNVSVIIPTHNRWPIVCDAIDSVLSQTYETIECIVVDDASTDNTASLLREKYGSEIAILSNPENREKSFSRNRGIMAAQSEYICFLDSDDVFSSDSVKVRMDIFKRKEGFDGVSFGICRPKDITQQKEKALFEYLEHNSPLTLAAYIKNKKSLCTNSFLMKKDAMLKYGMYNENLTNREDIELFVRLMPRLKFVFCGAHVGYVRNVATNRARQQWEKMASQQNALCNQLKLSDGVASSLGENINFMIMEGHLELLTALYHAGRYVEFIDAYRAVRQLKTSGEIGGFKYLKRYLLALVFQFRQKLKKNGKENIQQELLKFSLFDQSNRKSTSIIEGRYRSVVLEGSFIDTLLNDDSLNDFIAGSKVIKNDSDRKVLVGELVSGKNVFCKLYREKGMHSALRRWIVGCRALNAHYQFQGFSEIGQAAPVSLGYISKRAGFFHWQGFHFCEYIPNAKTLAEYLAEEKDENSRKLVVEKIAAALSKLHGDGFVHGDVKLNNILFSKGEIYFVDLDSFRKQSKRWSRFRDVARLLVGMSEVRNGKECAEWFYRSYCGYSDRDENNFLLEVSPLIEMFQKRHKKKYGRNVTKIL